MRERVGGVQPNDSVEELRRHRLIAKFPVGLRQVHMGNRAGRVGLYGFLKRFDRQSAPAELFLLHTEIVPERRDKSFGLGFLQLFAGEDSEPTLCFPVVPPFHFVANEIERFYGRLAEANQPALRNVPGWIFWCSG
jgi:hypothetical protein